MESVNYAIKFNGLMVMDIEQARFNMIEQQIRPWDVLDERILELVAQVPRERYVPARYRDVAFADLRIPLGNGDYMMEPKLEARILQALDVRQGDRVLEVGTGSGYLTACLADRADTVVSYEIDAAVSQQAHCNLSRNGFDNVVLHVADAMAGLPSGELFDVVVLTGSLPVMDERFHPLLKIGGRLFVVVGVAPAMEALLIERTGEDAWSQRSLFETELAPLINAPPAPSLFSL